MLMRTGSPEQLDAAALRQGGLKLLKDDIVKLLKFRGVEHKAGMKKAELLRLLVEHAFAGEGQDIVGAVMAKHAAGAKSQDEVLVDKLNANPQLAEVVDMLPTLDFESAQAFPELTKAQKLRTNPTFKAWAEFEARSREGNHAGMGSDAEPKGRKRPLDEDDKAGDPAPLADVPPALSFSSSSDSSNESSSDGAKPGGEDMGGEDLSHNTQRHSSGRVFEAPFVSGIKGVTCYLCVWSESLSCYRACTCSQVLWLCVHPSVLHPCRMHIF
jgi:hypothetical protein